MDKLLNKRVSIIFIIAAAALLLLSACSSEPKLKDSDVIGTWNVTSSGTSMSDSNDKGIYTLYKFDEDGKFHVIGLLKGQEISRDGSWKIEGEEVHFSLPEDQTSSAHADAIDDGVITIDGSTLKTSDIGNVNIEAEKISDEKVEEIYSVSKSFGPKEIALGQSVSGDGYTFTITSFDFSNEIYPTNRSGYYRYYQDESGKTYLSARVKITNDSTAYAGFCKATKATFYIGENEYSANIEEDTGTGFWSMYTLDAKDTGSYLISTSVPDSVKDSGEISLVWSFPRSASSLQNYYTSSGDNVDYVLKK